jgi:hypothetical protein
MKNACGSCRCLSILQLSFDVYILYGANLIKKYGISPNLAERHIFFEQVYIFIRTETQKGNVFTGETMMPVNGCHRKQPFRELGIILTKHISYSARFKIKARRPKTRKF